MFHRNKVEVQAFIQDKPVWYTSEQDETKQNKQEHCQVISSTYLKMHIVPSTAFFFIHLEKFVQVFGNDCWFNYEILEKISKKQVLHTT